MARRMLTDEIWQQLQSTMEAHGCYDTKNSRDVMEGILWKLRVGCPWEDIPEEFCPWKTAYNKFNRWAKSGLWDKFFLAYEEKLIRSGYSPTEAMSALTSMQVELGVVKSEPLEDPEEAPLPKSIWPVMRMETRSILKSLGVKFTTLKRPPKLFVKSRALRREGSFGVKQLSLFITFLLFLTARANCAEFGLRYDDSLTEQGFASPLIEVSIAGKNGLFLLDSGASVSVISTWFAERAGIQGTSPGKIGGSSGGSDATKLSKIQLTMTSSAGESVTYKEKMVAIIPLPEVFRTNGLSGILSPQQLLRDNETCYLDLGANPSLRLQEGESAMPSAYLPLSVITSTGPEAGTSTVLYTVQGKVYGLKTSFIVDTGADGASIGIETAPGKALIPRSIVTNEKVGGITGKPEFVRLLPHARVRLLDRNRNMKIRLQPVSTQMPAEGMLGMAFLKNCSIILTLKSGSISCQ